MRLGEIAEIKTGLVLTRKKAEFDFDVQKTYPLLTLNNIDEIGMFNDEPFEQFPSHEPLDLHYFTVEGDVLFRLNHPNTAIYIDSQHSGLLVPSYFAVIRVHHAAFLPAFIAWYLNLEIVKRELERSQAGTRILGTNRNVLKALLIPTIPHAKQQAIIDLFHLHHREKRLYQRLIHQKEQQFQAITNKIIQESSKEEQL